MPESAQPLIRTVIVGAGASGIALAHSLAADPAREVTLIEAGSGETSDPDLIEGGSLRAAYPGHTHNWTFPAQLSAERATLVTRGKVLGGSSAINGGYFVRATPTDYAAWAEIGGDRWSCEAATRIFHAFERPLDAATVVAPVTASLPAGRVSIATPPLHPTSAAFTRSARALGYPAETPHDSAAAAGVGQITSNIVNGVRASAAHSFQPQHNDRIRVVTDTCVEKILWQPRTTPSTAPPAVSGVQTTQGAIAADEVFLTAGAINSAHLLLLSGVGPREQLEHFGIPVVADLPVGQSFRDHPSVTVSFRVTPESIHWEAEHAFPTALHTAAAHTDPTIPMVTAGDIELLLAAKPVTYLLTGEKPHEATLEVLISLQEAAARGTVQLSSADPHQPPLLEHHNLQKGVDRARFRAAIRVFAAIVEQAEFETVFRGYLNIDAETIANDELLDRWVAENLGTSFHTTGTAPMGTVVDGLGAVHGVTGLRVADISILPTAPHRGPAHTAVFIGAMLGDALTQLTQRTQPGS